MIHSQYTQVNGSKSKAFSLKCNITLYGNGGDNNMIKSTVYVSCFIEPRFYPKVPRNLCKRDFLQGSKRPTKLSSCNYTTDCSSLISPHGGDSSHAVADPDLMIHKCGHLSQCWKRNQQKWPSWVILWAEYFCLMLGVLNKSWNWWLRWFVYKLISKMFTEVMTHFWNQRCCSLLVIRKKIRYFNDGHLLYTCSPIIKVQKYSLCMLLEFNHKSVT